MTFSNERKLLKQLIVCVRKSLGLVAILGLMPLAAAGENDPPALNQFVQEALQQNPRIKSAYHEWQAARYQVPQAGSLPDPMFGYGYFGESIETRVGPQEDKFEFSQKLPFPGKLNLKADAQRQQTGILQARHEAVRRDVIRQVKNVYFDLFWTDQAIMVTEQEKVLLKGIEQVALRKYETNQVRQQDVIKAQLELAGMDDKLLVLQQGRTSLQARLNQLLDRREHQTVPQVPLPGKKVLEYSLEDLLSFVRESGPELQQAVLAEKKAAEEKTLARMEYLPDFTVGVDYTRIGAGTTMQVNDGQDAWMAKVAINVPIWFHKLNAQVQEKQARLKAAKESLRDTDNMAVYEVTNIYAKVTSYAGMLDVYESALVPRSEQAFASSKTGYETGKNDFLTWLDAERTLLNTRLAYYRIMADYHKTLAELERIVGRDL